MKTTKKYLRTHIGEEHITKEGYIAKIIDGGSKNRYCTVNLDGITMEVQYVNLKNKVLRNTNHPTVYDKGFIGIGKYSIREEKAKSTKYRIWVDLLRRVYSKKSLIKNPTYANVKVCEEWLNFQNFAEWFNNSNYQEGWALDKDLLSGTSKIYSPDTCIFVPQEINNFMTNIKVTNTSGFIGVSWYKPSGRWLAQIQTREGKKHLGLFDDPEEASLAYIKARKSEAFKYRKLFKEVLPKKVINNIS